MANQVNGVKIVQTHSFLDGFLRGGRVVKNCGTALIFSFVVGFVCLLVFFLSFTMRRSYPKFVELGEGYFLPGAILFLFLASLYWGKYWVLKLKEENQNRS